MHPGRHAKLTPIRLEAFFEALRHGATRRAACAAVGISKTTFYNMLERDDGTLLAAIETAEGIAELTYSMLVAKAAPESWQAAAWWLERRKHEDYARRDKVDMKIDVRKEAQRIAAQSGLDESEIMAEAERILAEAQ